jgi:hypothetical protein
MAAAVARTLGRVRGHGWRSLAIAGVSTVATNALPIAAGTLLFGEAVPGGGEGAFRVLALASVVLGAALLARGETEGQPASAARAASTSSVVL